MDAHVYENTQRDKAKDRNTSSTAVKSRKSDKLFIWCLFLYDIFLSQTRPEISTEQDTPGVFVLSRTHIYFFNSEYFKENGRKGILCFIGMFAQHTHTHTMLSSCLSYTFTIYRDFILNFGVGESLYVSSQRILRSKKKKYFYIISVS